MALDDVGDLKDVLERILKELKNLTSEVRDVRNELETANSHLSDIDLNTQKEDDDLDIG